MKFKSTRAGTPPVLLSFEEAVLRGYAPDGGMLVPVAVPHVRPDTLRAWSRLCFRDLCEELFVLFVDEDDLPRADLRTILHTCFDEFTSHNDVVSVRHLRDEGGGADVMVAELFHGPTLAFKDLGLQFIGRLFEYLVRKRDRRLSVLVATSGDTGRKYFLITFFFNYYYYYYSS